jgi:hypothetical protein
MLHRFRSGRSVARVLAGTLITLGALGALAVATSPGVAASAHHTTSASAAIVGPNVARLGPDTATSTFIGYRDTDFHGTVETLTGCGPHNFSFPAHSYVFEYDNQHVFMYNCYNEDCPTSYVFISDGSSTTPVGWKSLYVDC